MMNVSKLACLRCKHKKIKCDRGQPKCHQCVTAIADCTYVERRQRPRLGEAKVEVRNLNRRVEFLEKQLQSGDQAPPHASPSPPSSEVPPSVRIFPPGSPNTSFAAEDGRDTWIYRMATDAKRNFAKVNTQSLNTPADTPDSHIDNAMSALDAALEDLGKLRVRSGEGVPNRTSLKVSPDEARRCVDIFLELIDSMVVPALFTRGLDLHILRSLADIVESPYVAVDPGLRVLYYNALFYGLRHMHGQGTPLAWAAYLKILETVPSWLSSPTKTNLDGHTAALTCWTAINNLDYHLSWKFHCMSCQFLRMKGTDLLDSTPAKTQEEENKRNMLRGLYWEVLQTDLLFRVFYDKPPAIKWSPDKVKAPSLFSPGHFRPRKNQVIPLVIWIQLTILTVEMVDFLDSVTQEERGEGFYDRVDRFCLETEELLKEWDLEILMKSENESIKMRFLYGDHVMNAYAMIVGIRRLTRRPNSERPVDEVTLRAARKVNNLILYFNNVVPEPGAQKFEFVQFIRFYPFCAVFSLYEHILMCNDPEECENDITLLENIGIAMQQASTVQADFEPFSNIIRALNKLAKTMQDERQRTKSHTNINPQTFMLEYQQLGEPEVPRQQQGINLPQPANSIFGPTNDNDSRLRYFPDLFVSNMDGDFQPLGFVRAVENDFFGRNWHEGWWDMDGDLSGRLPVVPEYGGPEADN
ncbi:hypothetical protein CC78DRAFT_549523 [Lojkania enalia]|uniref:Zn(2)-C6 fungal-type domain-containing protein n=1 Tax=Lojkania enalia TaxID=147567 RepID=A0A9P4JY17_9PLEO|nr:hypothetical protein CC78DRAFT_549523 [Didymosphaeria enalia]